MKKLLMLFLLMSFAVMPGVVFAQGLATGSEIIKVNNKVCPVSGEKIGSMGEAYKVVHDGKEYNLCCEMCVKDFKKNPEKYARIAEEEAQSGHTDHGAEHETGKKESHGGHGSHRDHGHHDHHH